MPSLAGVLVAGLLLSGCGFSPLYTTGPGGGGSPALVKTLESVQVSPIGGRFGQLVFRDLEHMLYPGGNNADPQFALAVRPVIEVDRLAFEADATETRYNLIVRASYTLTDTETNEVVLTGNTRAVSAYNRTESRYGSVIAREDAERNAATVLSENISLRVSVFLRSKSAQRQASETQG
ncbi:MAG: LPS assembly lipoprotein LptE [Pseudomonadota bacterium]